jgi:hypothetical protein
MKPFSRGSVVAMIAGCALAAALVSAPVQARDNDRARNDTSRTVQRDHNHSRDNTNVSVQRDRDRDRDRDNTGRSLQRNRITTRGPHNGYAYGQYRSNYRGRGYYRRGESAPFAYIGAANPRRYDYSRRYDDSRRYEYARRHRRHRRHHHD